MENEILNQILSVQKEILGAQEEMKKAQEEMKNALDEMKKTQDEVLGRVGSLEQGVKEVKNSVRALEQEIKDVRDMAILIEDTHGRKLNALFDSYSQVYEISAEIRRDVAFLKSTQERNDLELAWMRIEGKKVRQA